MSSENTSSPESVGPDGSMSNVFYPPAGDDCPYPKSKREDEPFAEPDFQDRHFTYRTDARKELKTLADLDIRTLAQMNETLADLLFLNVLTETQGTTIHSGDPSVIQPDRLPPAYIADLFGDIRATDSYYVHHKTTEWKYVYPPVKRKDLPENKGHTFEDAAEVSNIEHKLLRQAGSQVGLKFDQVVLPERLKAMRERFSVLLNQQYPNLVRENGGAFETIPPEKRDPLCREMNSIMGRLRDELSNLPSFGFKVGGQVYSVSNETPLIEDMPLSKPLPALFALTFAGEKGVDHDRFPPLANNFFSEAIGVESLITNVTSRLTHHLREETGQQLQFPKTDHPDIKQIEAQLKKSSRSLKLLHQFHETLSQGYDMALGDIKRQLGMIGETTELRELNTPKEIAAMLYATAKRLDPEATADVATAALSRRWVTARPNMQSTASGLLSLAGAIANEEMPVACAELAGHQDVLEAARKYMRQVTAAEAGSQAPAALDLIRATLEAQGFKRATSLPDHS